ncbi:MAG: 16S rRNA (cytosine(967)-C(5))-methyltransferase RsmB [Steroidobacteraceae bacterium]
MAKSLWTPGAAALAGAAQALDSVLSYGCSAEAALGAFDTAADRAAIRAISLGTIRWYLRLAPALEPLLSRPSAVSAPVAALLCVAAHQIEYSRNAPEATVHAAVDAVRILKSDRAAGFVNAVLRRFVRERAALFARADQSEARRWAHPAWLIEKLKSAWPAQYGTILAANNAHPPMTLRLDLSRISRVLYLEQLSAAGIESLPNQWIDSAVTLKRPVAVSVLPGFMEGNVSVQDAGAQLAARLLDVRAGMRVLDACAAPGGKTGHLLERAAPGVTVTALDIDAARVSRIDENLKRLRRQAQLIVADASKPETFWDGKPFDRILVDAPCSSTGVLRRHPDIKLLRRPGDIAQFAAGQLAILEAAAGMLAPGGRLLYCTCSVLPEENEALLGRWLADQPGMLAADMPRAADLAPGASDRLPGVQLLPGAEAGTDGFYYACLEKTTTGT